MKKEILIIAEAGVNHNGDMNLAKKLIEAAAKAGANIIKFQTFNANRLVTKFIEKAEYQVNSDINKNESQLSMLSKLELTAPMHKELIKHCSKSNIEFLSTGFDIKDIEFLVQLGVQYIKIPSGEITNIPYLRYIGNQRKSVILSTGMSNLADIEIAIDVLEKSGTPRNKVTLLHCTSSYPAPLEEVNLRAMEAMSKAFDIEIGYSDHTQGIEVSIAAVAMGAKIIEKHFTMDRNLPGPDHQMSLEPSELKAMITSIRNIELAFGDGIKRPTSSELKNINFIRKSIVAKQKIKKGEIFTEENIAIKRPGSGVSPIYWDQILGKIALQDYCEDDFIKI
jgi:N,N'-diacetyllegionaminate synthase